MLCIKYVPNSSLSPKVPILGQKISSVIALCDGRGGKVEGAGWRSKDGVAKAAVPVSQSIGERALISS